MSYYDREVETLTRKEINELQFDRLKWQALRCYESPFYRDKWDAVGFSPRHLQNLSGVANIPFVTKDELRLEQAKFPPFGRFVVGPRETWREIHPSSGTTGNPVYTIWGEDDIANITDVTARTMWSFGVRPGDIIQNAFSYGLWVAGMSAHYAAGRLGCLVIPIGAQLTNKQIEFIVGAGSTVLLCTPSYSVHIAERIAEAGISPDDTALRLGCFGGEGGTENPGTRSKIERGLGISAYDYYGIAELGPTFASECTEKAGLHWAEDHYYVEVVDPGTKMPCSEGETGVLVITHLTRQTTPMVRYWTNDMARVVHEPCRCGRTHARSPGGILGRSDDLVIYKGAKFYPLQVEKVVRSFTELSSEYRVELACDEVGHDVCTVVVEEVAALAPSVRESFRKALREEILVTPEIRVQPFGTLERTAFKAKRLFDLRHTTVASPD
ncbi:MAG: phenylacetate--CoA ligase [Peptococcaceae bacterium]|nr:phenylacetate--CoA ligase [Peptococcaceae bacterium]